jgi:hypothetical protein
MEVVVLKYLKPHSPEWFAALKKVNPNQAAQTKQILSLAGRDDVCSICGDVPATDYRLAGAQPTSGSVATLRLCKDCIGIRRTKFGEDFVPFTN